MINMDRGKERLDFVCYFREFGFNFSNFGDY